VVKLYEYLVVAVMGKDNNAKVSDSHNVNTDTNTCKPNQEKA
jgi:hypothetical protein